MTLAIVRHAHAGSRAAWQGDDRVRPLSERGHAQSRTIADRLAPLAPSRLLTSPAVRCQQTLGPLGLDLGLDVEVDDRLFEGPDDLRLRDLLVEVADADVVVCTHGDVVPALLDLLIDDGMPAPVDLRWHKGSVWLVERAGAAWAEPTYWYDRAPV